MDAQVLESTAALLPTFDTALLEERIWRRSPYELLRKQAGTPEVFAPLVPPARYKAARGGRGGAKSHFFGDLAVTRTMRESGLRMVCVREIQNSLRQSVKKLLEDRIAERGLSAHYRVLESEIRTPGNGLIIFQGMKDQTNDSIKSLESFDIAWVEEAQTLSKRSLEKLRPTIRKPGSEMWFSWNPRSPEDPVDAFFYGPGGPPPGAVRVTSSYLDNPYLSDESRADLEWDKLHNPDKFKHVWLGEYEKHTQARVFQNWRVDEFEIDKHWGLPLYGGDWGFAADPTVLVKMYLTGRRLFIVGEVWGIGVEITDTPKLFDRLDKGEARRHPIVADCARPETISHLKNHGYPLIEPSVKGPNSVEEGVKFIQDLEVVVHPRCKHVIDELTNYKYKVDPLTEEILPILVDESNHTIDSIRYALERSRKPKRLVAGGV
jgi:phage terminase large subunit